MELRDFIVTPIVLFVIYAVAYRLRPIFTDHNTKRYFIPALTVRIVGALAVGFIYQFYYGGGDTFNYHVHGSRIIWEAFKDNPVNGMKLIFGGSGFNPDLYPYYSKIWYFGDLPSYFVIRVAALFDLITFSAYSATAILFACVSFTGAWALYQVFYHRFSHLHSPLALANLFVPSVFFWGAGILKDTLTLAAAGLAVYSFDQVFFKKSRLVANIILFLVASFIIFSIKKYILMCLIPALMAWLYMVNVSRIHNVVIKILVAPIIFILTSAMAYYAITKVGESDSRYALDNLAETARTTAYDIRYGWGARMGQGSGYTLGELDGSFLSTIRLFPAAVNVSLFRPYLWEVNNPFMLLSSLESLTIFILTIMVIIKKRVIHIIKKGSQPIILFCLVFSLVFAFAVGVSTYNFGTLMRYKIPVIPFYLSSVILLYLNNDKKLTELDSTE